MGRIEIQEWRNKVKTGHNKEEKTERGMRIMQTEKRKK